MRKFFAFFEKKSEKKNKAMISYLVCVIIATVLWSLNALNKEYDTSIMYPIKYINYPIGRFPNSQLPKEFLLNVHASGFSILSQNINSRMSPMVLDLNKYANSKNNTSNKEIVICEISTSSIREKLGHLLSSDIKLQEIYPAFLNINFIKAANKKVAIKSMVNYTLKRQFTLKNEIYTTPDSILISAPISIIDDIENIKTKEVILKDIDKNTVIKTELLIPKDVYVNNDDVTLHLDVEQYTEAKRIFPINVINIPKDKILKLFPNKVEISYKVGLSHYKTANNDNFSFIVDYKQTSNSSYLTIKCIDKPNYISDMTISPKKVEYIIDQKEDNN